MRIQVQTQGFELTPAIDLHVRKQLTRNLANVEEHVVSASAFLGDINGPRGGNDKKVLLSVQLSSRQSVQVERVHSDLYAAATQAARQVQRSVKRTLQKRLRMEKALLREMRLYPADYSAS